MANNRIAAAARAVTPRAAITNVGVVGGRP